MFIQICINEYKIGKIRSTFEERKKSVGEASLVDLWKLSRKWLFCCCIEHYNCQLLTKLLTKSEERTHKNVKRLCTELS